MNVPNSEEFLKGCEEFEKHEKRDAMYRVATFLVSHFWGKPSDMADGLGVLLLTWNQAFYRYGIFDFDKLEECIADKSQKIESFRDRDISILSSTDEDEIKDLFAKFLEALQIDTIRFSDKNKKRETKRDLENFLRKIDVVYKNSDNLETLYSSIKNNQEIKKAVRFISKEESNSKKDYIEIKISKLKRKEVKTLESLGLIRRSPVSVTKTLHLLAPNFFPLWDEKIARAYGCYYNENPAEKYVSFCKVVETIADKVKDYIERSDKSILKLIDEYNHSKYTQGWI